MCVNIEVRMAMYNMQSTCLPRRTPVELLYGIVGNANGQGE